MTDPHNPDNGGHRPDNSDSSDGDGGAASGPNEGQGRSPLENLRANRSDSAQSSPAGNMRRQTPESAVRREPTLAESRERDRVRREAERAARLQAQEDQRNEEKRRRRKTYLISGGVGLGLVAILAATYMSSAGGGGADYETAQCTNEQGVVVDDQVCENATEERSGPGGMFFFLVGGSMYRYSYGSNAPVGAMANGSTTPQSGKSYATGNGREVTNSGKTGGPVSRGGLGSSSGSKGSSGGKGFSSGS
ncbi:hypothetical protein [Dietzia timorensis]|uniref:Uncharacterized protein n=1 Tax=Dietzia timorensis TaxID=499555 RepID=A0A173LLV4_9ACTN|nr:hypothetical protein [Dietzia timorensis]ANI92644.1 Hypothetical protein BJL86_1873 [Dietzia timorensis]